MVKARGFDKDAGSWDDSPLRTALAKDVAAAVTKQVRFGQDMDVLDFGCGVHEDLRSERAMAFRLFLLFLVILGWVRRRRRGLRRLGFRLGLGGLNDLHVFVRVFIKVFSFRFIADLDFLAFIDKDTRLAHIAKLHAADEAGVERIRFGFLFFGPAG